MGRGGPGVTRYEQRSEGLRFASASTDAVERGTDMALKVLVVDDSSFVRQHVRRVLTEAGFDIVEAADGDIGLDIIQKTSDLAMVVCDVNMPNRSGLEMLEELARASGAPRIPVVMLTTEGQHELILKAKSLGAKGWIVKPFKPEMLVLTVKKLTAAAASAA
jgi:two-component system, chemotaxis family, chemotaxis protein CheY